MEGPLKAKITIQNLKNANSIKLGLLMSSNGKYTATHAHITGF